MKTKICPLFSECELYHMSSNMCNNNFKKCIEYLKHRYITRNEEG